MCLCLGKLEQCFGLYLLCITVLMTHICPNNVQLWASFWPHCATHIPSLMESISYFFLFIYCTPKLWMVSLLFSSRFSWLSSTNSMLLCLPLTLILLYHHILGIIDCECNIVMQKYMIGVDTIVEHFILGWANDNACVYAYIHEHIKCTFMDTGLNTKPYDSKVNTLSKVTNLISWISFMVSYFGQIL